MGYIRHELTVITGLVGTDDHYDFTRQMEALRREMPPEFQRLLVGPIESTINGDLFAFLVLMAPDGSKEGWDTSKEGERWRRRLVELSPFRHLSVRWGDDEATAEVREGYESMEDDGLPGWKSG